MTIISIARAYPIIAAFLIASQALVHSNYDAIIAEEEALLSQGLLEGSFEHNTITWEKEDPLQGNVMEYMLQPYPYIMIEPGPDQYVIRLLIEPCLGQSPYCCNNTYGTPEFPVYPDRDSSESRVVPKLVHAPLDRRLEGLVLLWEDQTEVVRTYSRFADDETEVDDTCLEKGIPDEGCIMFRLRQLRSSLPLRCTDNNRTVSGTSHYKDIQGDTNNTFMMVGYTQTALISVCGGSGDVEADYRCGIFLEVHIAQRNHYVEVEHIISSTHILTPNVTGYVTTQVPTTLMLNSSRVLCAYSHVDKLVGTQVLITGIAPTCCIPKGFSQSDMLGSFFCPRIGSAQGPWASTPETISDLLTQDIQLSEPPFCPNMKNTDGLFVSKYDEVWSRHYTREALPVEQDPNTLWYTSGDLDGSYESPCPYFPGGGVNTDGSITCGGQDMLFTFIGHVGRITNVPDPGVHEDRYSVTFNGGRTTYMFSEEEIKVEHDEHNYELWWVQRAQGRSIVKRKKNFAVQSPPCTFDTIHDRYFPYAKLDVLGHPID